MSVLKKLQESGRAKTGSQSNNTFGAVLRVASASKDAEGNVTVVGVVQTSHSSLKANEEVTVKFRGDQERVIGNLEKGLGKKVLKNEDNAKDAFLVLEGCYVTDENDGDRRVLNSRWVTTLVDADNDEHENRSFIEGVLAKAPRISFENPNPLAGEPKSITLPLNAGEKISVRVETERGRFTGEMPVATAIEKLKAATKPRVEIDTITPAESVSFSNKDELVAALTSQLAAGTKAFSVLRVAEGAEVVSRAVYVQYKKNGDEYVPDVDGAIESLLKNNIFSGIANDEVFAALAAGELKGEAVPGYRMTYAGDPSKDKNAAYKLVQDVINGKRQHMQMIFGKDPNGYASVLLPGIARNDSVAGFSPFNVIANEQGVYTANSFATAHIDPKARPTPAVPADDGEDMNEPEQKAEDKAAAPAPRMA